MKKIIILSVFFLLIKSSMAQIDSISILDKFSDLSKMPSTSGKLEDEILNSSDTINCNILTKLFLIPINEIELSDKYFKNRYYYCGKYKLDSTHYLIGYRKKYDFHARKIVFSVYDVNLKRIISSLVISDIGGCIQRKSYYEDGVFVITNKYVCVPNGLDPKPGEEYIEKNYTEKYILNKDFCFDLKTN